MSSPPSEVTAGVDLGGTGTRIVALDRDGVVLHQVSRPTPASSAGAVSGLVSSIAAAAAGQRLRGVGIGASGPVDSLGIIRNTETLPAFSDIQITPVISERLGVPCVIDNDAVVAAVGEHACGAGRSSAGLLVVTLGTGVGVAALTGGRPFRGDHGGLRGVLRATVEAAPQAVAEQVDEPRRAAGDDDPVGAEDGQQCEQAGTDAFTVGAEDLGRRDVAGAGFGGERFGVITG